MIFRSRCEVRPPHRPGELAKLISETFSEMIFTHGHVHCDPHAANMLVRKGGDGRMQLVLLDHGLYRTLSDEFRMEYAGLWRALIFADEAGIRTHSEGMNAGEAVPVFAALITQRPWEHASTYKDRIKPAVYEVDSYADVISIRRTCSSVHELHPDPPRGPRQCG